MKWSTTGKYGGALEFSGTQGECVKAPDAEDLHLSGNFTLEAWVRPTGTEHDMVVFKDSNGHKAQAMGVGVYTPAKLEGLIGDGEGKYESVVGTQSIEPNVWTHLAYTYDGANMRVYVNGVLAATKARTKGAAVGQGPLAIGCNPDYTQEVFAGKIDDVRVHDRALSAAESPPTPPPSLTHRTERGGGSKTVPPSI